MELTEMLGSESAELLVLERGGEEIRVPARSSMASYKRRLALIKDFKNGAGYREVAKRYGLSLSWAHRLRRKFDAGAL
jgi:Mor family transcriptional regulator